jgi:hypothetical protein
MPLPILFGMAVIMIVIWSLLQGTATQQRLANAASVAQLRAEEAWKALLYQYKLRLQPILRRSGYLALAFLVIIAASMAFIPKAGATVDVTLPAIIVTCVAVFLIWWEMQRTPENFSIYKLASAIFGALLLESVTLLLVGVNANDRGVVMIAATCVIMARSVMSLMLESGAAILAYLVYSAEGGTNFIVRTAVAFMPQGIRDNLKGLLPTGGVVFAVEEKWVPGVQAAMRRFNAAVYPSFLLCILVPQFSMLTAGLLGGLVNYMLWGILEGADIDTTSRRKASALLLEKIVYVLFVCALLVVFVPGAEAEIDRTYAAFPKMLTHALRMISGALLSPSGAQLLVGFLIGGALLYFLLPRGDAAAFPRLRKLLALPLVIMVLVLGFFFFKRLLQRPLAVAWNEKATVEDDAEFKLKAYTAVEESVVATKAVKKPVVRLEWRDVPEADSYQIERRDGLGRAGFVPLAGCSLPRGATTFDDETATVAGMTYSYRVVALLPAPKKGQPAERAESNVVQVTIPLPAPPPSTSASARPAPSPPVACATCDVNAKAARASLCANGIKNACD